MFNLKNVGKMRKLKLVLLSFMLCVFTMSCENKVSDELSTSDVKSLIEKDTLYVELIPKIQLIQNLISKNVLLNAKYSDITYQQCLNYEKEKNKAKDVFIETHKKDVDKKIGDLKNKIESFRKLMNVSFYGTRINFYEYTGGVRNGYFKFKISVTEPIRGGGFKYSITDKTTDKEVENGIWYFAQNIKDSYIGACRIPYSSEDEFAYQSVNDIKNRYNFDFTILSVHKNGELKEDDITLTSDAYKALILKKFKINLFDSGYIPFEGLNEDELYEYIIFDEYSKEWNEICKKIDPEVFDYFSNLEY